MRSLLFALAFFALLPAHAVVIDGSALGWTWQWDYETFVRGEYPEPYTDADGNEIHPDPIPPTPGQHLAYCVQRIAETDEAINALWELENIPLDVSLNRDEWAQALGMALIQRRFFSRCKWQQESRIATEGLQ